MFKLIVIVLSIFFSSVSFADILKCNFTKYNGNFRLNTAKQWVPEYQTHQINDRNAIYLTKNNMKGQITQNNDEKIKWFYTRSQKITLNSGGINKMRSKFSFIFFKSNNKVAASVTFPHHTWVPFDNIWGTCKLEKSGSQSSNLNSKQSYDNTLSETSKKSKTCLYKPTTYKTPMLYNCMITVNSNEVSELYYPPDSSGNVCTGIEKFCVSSLEKYQIQNSKNKCPVEVSNEFIDGLKYVTEKYKDNKSCAGLKHYLDKINCKYILNIKNKDFNMGNTKLLYQNFAKKIMDEFNLVKANIFYNDSKITSTINIKNKIYEINDFQRDKFGFLKYNFSTLESVFSSLTINDNEKNYLSLSGALGSIDYEGNCDTL